MTRLFAIDQGRERDLHATDRSVKKKPADSDAGDRGGGDDDDDDDYDDEE